MSKFLHLLVFTTLIMITVSPSYVAAEEKLSFKEKVEKQKADKAAKKEAKVQALGAENETQLVNIKSEVFKSDLSQSEILDKAKICMAQAGDRDVTEAGGSLVAKTHLEFANGFLMTDEVKTTLTLKAKDNAFKMRHTNITRYIDSDFGRGWNPVLTSWGSRSEGVVEHLQLIMNNVASCINTKDEW